MDWRRLLGRHAPKPRAVRGPERLTPDLRVRIRSSFDEASRDEEHFPSTIDPRIWHVRLILFARILAERNPGAEVWGLDISPAMLRYVPAPVHPCAGSMTELPFPEAYFDAAYATESLEHAVEIGTAVAEMCRVVKPGGRLAVIDKNAEHYGRLETPEWEKWFTRRELEELFARHCRRVESRFISYWEDVEPDGLFIAWTAEK